MTNCFIPTAFVGFRRCIKKQSFAALYLFGLSCHCRLFFTYSAMSYSTSRDDSGTIVVSPKNEADQSALLVISHGLGDTAEGFVDVAENLVSTMPYLKVILPTAPVQPVTLNMGMPTNSWYDIIGLDERSNESCKGIEESQKRLIGILEAEHQSTGLPYSRMMLAGFSQGGALSLFTGLQLPNALAGIVAMSSYLPAASKFTLVQPGVPVLHCHGTQDPLVRFEMGQKTQMLLKKAGIQNYELKSYPIQHTVNMDVIAAVTAFIKEKLPTDDTCKVTLPDPSTMSVKELKAAIRKAGLSSKTIGFTEKSEFINLLQNYRDGKL